MRRVRMPVKALLVSTGDLVYSWEVRGWPEERRRGEAFICPKCRGEMVFVDARVKRKHFRHRARCPYEVEPETEDHEAMKELVYEWLSNLNGEADVEVTIGENIADVVSGDVVVEVQYSYIDVKELLRRTENYTKHGYYTMWLLHKDFRKWRKWFVVMSRSWRFLIYLNHGHLYFLDPETSKLGKYKLRKNYGGRRLAGFRYAVVEKKWEPLQKFSIFKYEIRLGDGRTLLVARPVLW